jgi:hypothetical protein
MSTIPLFVVLLEQFPNQEEETKQKIIREKK